MQQLREIIPNILKDYSTVYINGKLCESLFSIENKSYYILLSLNLP